MFAGLGAAKVVERGEFFTPGAYRGRLKGVFLVESQQKRGERFFVVEFVNEEFRTTHAQYETRDRDPAGNYKVVASPVWPAGAEMSQAIDLSGQVAMSNVKGLLTALDPTMEQRLGTDQRAWEAEALRAVGPEQPWANAPVCVKEIGRAHV